MGKWEHIICKSEEIQSISTAHDERLCIFCCYFKNILVIKGPILDTKLKETQFSSPPETSFMLLTNYCAY